MGKVLKKQKKQLKKTMPIILKTALKYLLRSLLIPWLIKNLDTWTTSLNKKILKLLENENET